MRRWQLIPLGLILLVVIGLPVAALTDTGVEQSLRRELGLETGECEPMTNLASSWSPTSSLPSDLDEPRSAVLDGRVYLIGGVTGVEPLANGGVMLDPSDQLTVFDPADESYTELTPMPDAASHMGVVSDGRYIYVLGGYGRDRIRDTSNRFFRYDPAADRWDELPKMPQPRAAMAAGIVDGQLILAGGAEGTEPKRDVWAFDLERESWRRLPSMKSRREHVGAAVLGGELYVLGGRSPDSLADDTAESFDVTAAAWSALPPLPVGTGGMATVVEGGEVVVVGGGNDGAGTVTGAVQAWDPGQGEWSLLDEMRTPRHGHAAAVAGGKVWVFGGSPCAYFNATDSVEALPLGSLG